MKTVALNKAPRIGWMPACLGLGLCAYVVLAYQTAWLSDDALISLRTADNWLHGYGLRWNVDERVQTFTHPLWMFLLAAGHAITGEPFYSSLYLSWIISSAAVACLLFVCAGQVFDKLIALLALMLSQAFVDFSSSGLENPLTHFLIALFVAVHNRQHDPRRRAVWLSLLAGCAAFNRLDTCLLFAPALLAELLRARSWQCVRWHMTGAIPVAAWELFSLLYYGFPFPNTAYAKLSQGNSAPFKLVFEGINYLRSSFATDPITLAMIAACVGLALARRDRRTGALLLGALLYLAYVLRIGGDFMSGRFLSGPLFLSVAWLSSSDTLHSNAVRVLFVALALGSGLLGKWPPPLTGGDFRLAPGESDVDQFGIHNERRIFFPINSLRHAHETNPLRDDHPWSHSGFELRAAVVRDPNARVQVIDAIGHAGYFAGPDVHIVDHWALADALIARLPALFGRYGHYPRVIPEGYIATLRTHTPQLQDRDLAKYYADLVLVIRAPLFEPERLRAIWRLNTQRSATLDRYAYVRHTPLNIRLRFTNPSDQPSVQTYVWNDFRATSYLIDTTSTRGKSYEIAWSIKPDEARLLAPADAVQTTRFANLRERGIFTVSVAFAPRPDAPISDLHELRYTYELTSTGWVVQRQPWPVWISNFPHGPWHDGRAPGVLEQEKTN